MVARSDDDQEMIDHRTSRSICEAIGERLQQHLKPEAALSEQLKYLLNELRRRDLHGRP